MNTRLESSFKFGGLAMALMFAQTGIEAQVSSLLSLPFRGVARIETIKRNSPKYKALSTFPQFTAKTPLTSSLNTQLRKEALANIAGFVKTANEDENSPGTRAFTWEFQNNTKLHFYQPTRLISLGVETYVFSGGAHGNYGTSGRTFGVLPGTKQPHELHLADFFRAGSPYRSRIESRLMARLRATKGKEQEASWTLDGTVKKFDTGQLDNFVAERDGLRWFFAPYAVGPYVSGEFEVKLSPAELGPDFKRALLNR